MLSFREQIVDLKKQTLIEKGKKCERDVKVIASRVLQTAFDSLKKETPSIILDFQGVNVSIIGESSICINYFDERTFFSFTLSMYEGNSKEDCIKIFDAIKEILKEEEFRISSPSQYCFMAYL